MSRLLLATLIFMTFIIALLSFIELVMREKFIRSTVYEKTVQVTSRGIADGGNELVFCNSISFDGFDRIIESQELYHSGADSVIIEVEETNFKRGQEVYSETEIIGWRLWRNNE